MKSRYKIVTLPVELKNHRLRRPNASRLLPDHRRDPRGPDFHRPGLKIIFGPEIWDTENLDPDQILNSSKPFLTNGM